MLFEITTGKPVTDDRGGESSVPSPTALRPWQNVILSPPFPLSFIAQGGKDVRTWVHHLYSLSLRTEIRLDFLVKECVLPSIFTSADLHLTMYNLSKLAPACKGRFTHPLHRFRLRPIFSTTTSTNMTIVKGSWDSLVYNVGWCMHTTIWLWTVDNKIRRKCFGCIHVCVCVGIRWASSVCSLAVSSSVCVSVC